MINGNIDRGNRIIANAERGNRLASTDREFSKNNKIRQTTEKGDSQNGQPKWTDWADEYRKFN